MPTLEERLSLLEQTVAEYRPVLRDISHNETILLGMAVKHEELLREIRVTQAQILARLEAHEQHFAAMDQRFDRLEHRFDRLEQQMSQILTLLRPPSS
jgi:phosphoglycolate phosphatase-like HAD superfamily hydrolase